MALMRREESLADVIVGKARSIGLDVSYNVKTPGDGACLYHAILEGLDHRGLMQETYNRANVQQLRLDVVDFVNSSWDIENNVEPPDYVQRWLGQQLDIHQTHVSNEK